MKISCFKRIGQFFAILGKKEKIIFLLFLTLFIAASISLYTTVYLKNSQVAADFGGSFAEGVIGQPRWINPIYAATNDVDHVLVELIFSGLVKYNGQGEIIGDLAQDWQIKEEGRVFEFELKENLFWEDGQPLSNDDIIFTVETIQNPAYKSPLRASWLGVEIEEISRGIRFTLKDPYPRFLETAALKILPKHIWQEVPPERFPLALYNLQPLGSGPYKLTEIEQDKLGYIKSLTLQSNQRYHGKKPFIPRINFSFFSDQDSLKKAAQQGKIDAFSPTLLEPGEFPKDFAVLRLTLPRYFAVFFNPQESEILAEAKVRQALNYGTDQQAILKEVLNSQGSIVLSPILGQVYGFQEPKVVYQFDPGKAQALLKEAGFEDQNNDGIKELSVKKEKASAFKSQLKYGGQSAEVTELQKCLAQDPEVYPEGEVSGYFGPATKRAVTRFQEKYASEILQPSGLSKGTGIVGPSTRSKLNEVCGKTSVEFLPLKFSLVTADQTPLIQTAQALKKQWKVLGVDLEIKKVTLAQLEKDFIKKRDYQALLFGEVLETIPDLFPFWHSSQKYDPGLNLCLWRNSQADKLLESARRTADPAIVAQNYEKFQDILLESAPAVFLFNPDYLYLLSEKIKGSNLSLIANPSKRFSTITEWYIKTKRKWK